MFQWICIIFDADYCVQTESIHTHDRRMGIPFVLIFIFQLFLVYKYLLQPYCATDVSLVWKINAIFYFTLSSVIFAFILPFSNRVNDRTTFWFLNTILLLLTEILQFFYQDIFIDNHQFSWAESIWRSTLIGFVWFAYFSFDRNDLFIPNDLQFAPLISIRRLLPIAIFGANTILLAGILILKKTVLENAMDISNLLLFLILFWTIANEFSIWFANDLGGVLHHMFKGNELLSSDGSMQFRLEPVKAQNPIFEISQMLASYNCLISKTNDMMEHALEANKNRAIATVATQVSHDIQSPLAALGMSAGSD